jgi:hypothetical protein
MPDARVKRKTLGLSLPGVASALTWREEKPGAP